MRFFREKGEDKELGQKGSGRGVDNWRDDNEGEY